MNITQRTIIYIALSIFAITGLFPPNESGGFAFVLYNPWDTINTTALKVFWSTVAIVAGGLLWLFDTKGR